MDKAFRSALVRGVVGDFVSEASPAVFPSPALTPEQDHWLGPQTHLSL